MKRIALLVLMMASVAAYAQKAEKPNLNKALKSFQEGKLAEAKSNIDLAITYEKTMNDGKTWYYRGLIYAALDTTKNEEFKALAPDALKTSVEAFAKADAIEKGGKEYFITGKDGLTPILKSQQLEGLANYYLDKSIKIYQDGEDYPGAITWGLKSAQVFETMKTYPNDTLAYYVMGLAAQNAEQYDVAIESINKFLAQGGKGKEAYLILYQIYSGPKADKLKALEVARQGKQKLPNNSDFPKLEIGLLIDLDRVAEAKGGLEEALKKDQDNKILHFYLGYVNSKLELWDDAKANFNAALKLDPNYFEAQYYLAQVYFIDAVKVKKEMDNLGISAADKKRKVELDKLVVEKYKAAVPYWEKAEQLKSDDLDVLDKLSALYYYLGEDAKVERVSKKKNTLGAE